MTEDLVITYLLVVDEILLFYNISRGDIAAIKESLGIF